MAEEVDPHDALNTLIQRFSAAMDEAERQSKRTAKGALIELPHKIEGEFPTRLGRIRMTLDFLDIVELAKKGSPP